MSMPKNEIKLPKKPIKAKLVILGATGDGKSSLGNFILNKKDLFRVSDDPESETKETIGHNGINGAENIFVIDTPGLQDTRASDKKHIVNMVNYVKNHKDIQAIIVVFNFHQDRFAPYLKTMIKIFNDIFVTEDFWFHVGFVFTKYFKDMRKKFEKKKEKKIEKYIGQIKELVKECKRKCPNNFNTYFIDSDMDDIDEYSVEECKRLLGWVSSLEPLDTSNAKEVDDKIKSTQKEVREIEGPSRWERNIEYKTLIKLERCKNIHYDGTITFSEEREISRYERRVVHEKELVNSRFDEKEELSSRFVGKKEIKTTKYLRRKILTYNDGSTVEGNWEEYKSPNVKKKEHPKILKDIRDEFRSYEIYGFQITQQRKIRIFDDGSVDEGYWITILAQMLIPRPFQYGRTILNILVEKKVEKEKDFIYDTETQKIINIDKDVLYERNVIFYSDGTAERGNWMRMNY